MQFQNPGRRASITALEMFDYFVSTNPERLAIKTSQIQYSYGHLDHRANQLANAMSANGIAKGDRVAVLCLNHPYQLVLLLATMKLGAIYVPINFRLTATELKYILDQSEAKLIFTEQNPFGEMLDSISVDTLESRVYLDEASSIDHKNISQFCSESTENNSLSSWEASQQPENIVYQMYTSGTTGFPKGVLITQQQLALFMVQIMLLPQRANPGDTHIVVAPLYHAAALCSAILGLCTGRTLVVMREFEPIEVVQTIVKEKAKDIVMVPAMIQACLAFVPDIDKYDFTSLEKVLYGASPISVSVLEQAIDVFQCNFQQCFGMTEMVASATFLTVEDHHLALNGRPDLLRSAGKAGPFLELKIVDPDTRVVLEQGESGEVCVRAPYAMLGYSKQPEATSEVFEDGWYFTGDGGYLDEDGYLFLNDRIKDMIVSGGENIYPAELENVLMAHEAIKDVAVVGTPNDTYGEVPLAFCVVERDNEKLAPELIEHCKARLAGYKIPKEYRFIDEIPRNGSGKILKRVLREM